MTAIPTAAELRELRRLQADWMRLCVNVTELTPDAVAANLAWRNAVNCYILELLAAAERLAVIERSQDSLPERFCAAAFVRAGLSLEDASAALMVARRILEDAERDREKKGGSDG